LLSANYPHNITPHQQTTNNQQPPTISMRIFSGMQPTGEPHLGNYLGAIRGWAANQGGERENFFCIVDLHSLTVPYDPDGLRDRSRKLAATFFAAGIDPEVSPVFIQSHVSAHA